ncbi:MAG: hypothetical protein J6E31_03070 [Pyramidobacter sp.]|nr:hypothetical protein [Pyramidobacter sp.]
MKKRYDEYTDEELREFQRQRMTCPIYAVVPLCNECRHSHPTGLTCDAFPNGIPKDILCNKHDHHKPYEGDGGIQFEAWRSQKERDEYHKKERESALKQIGMTEEELQEYILRIHQ